MGFFSSEDSYGFPEWMVEQVLYTPLAQSLRRTYRGEVLYDQIYRAVRASDPDSESTERLASAARDAARKKRW